MTRMESVAEQAAEDAPESTAFARPSDRFWIDHAPALLGFFGAAIGLGVAAYMFLDLSDIIGKFTGDATSMAEPALTTASSAPLELPVVIRFSGHGVVAVDGKAMGAADDTMRLTLPAGEHVLGVRLQDRAGSEAEEKNTRVFLIEGTEPVFDFTDSYDVK